jgi:hypothetical protein
MSLRFLSWIWDHSPQRGSLKLLLLAMTDAADQDRWYRTDLDRLAHLINEREYTLRSLILELETDGAIVGGGARQFGVSEFYQIAGPEPIEDLLTGPRSYRKAVVAPTLRAQVFARDGYQCRHCGATQGLCIDHIYPERHGGASTMDNLQTLCRSCNSRKGARLPDGTGGNQ